MNIFLYVLVPVLIVALWAVITWLRNRQPTSLEAGLDSFRREMEALSPEAAPNFRRREEPGGARPAGSPGPDGTVRPTRPGPPRPPRPPASRSGP